MLSLYYPPDFDPAKHGSLNKYRNSHPLRERARKLSQGILIIRFEMPYNIWCDGCQNHIGMGVRYNAEKKKVGNYYTTPIYRFRMKCHLCPNHIEMQTDPANCDYVIVSGARRKEERWDVEANEQIVATAHEEKQKLETDAMYRLEHGSKDQSKLQRALPTLQNIQEAQSAWKDDFALNSRLRRKFREEKKVLQEEEKKDLALQSKACLSIPLVRESDEDRHLAALLKYQSLGCTVLCKGPTLLLAAQNRWPPVETGIQGEGSHCCPTRVLAHPFAPKALKSSRSCRTNHLTPFLMDSFTKVSKETPGKPSQSS
uniref:Probable splicing factor YJU2B n=1 Tax=Podarcis muralis TaxID=64176 RepID=A0A670KIE9_PODMU